MTRKFGLSSSGCESRPAKAEPAQPVASLATRRQLSAMRSHASSWAVGNAATKTICPGCRGFDIPKAQTSSPQQGEGDAAPGGVYDHGTQQEDGPGTWEAHAPPGSSGVTETRTITLRRAVRQRTHAAAGTEEAFAPR